MLRGINVGGKRRIKMADLRAVFEKIDLGEVETYLQSGNVVFRSKKSPDHLQHVIKSQIRKELGVDAEVLIRSAKDLEMTMKANPFIKDALIEKVHVTFLADLPESGVLESLAIPETPEKFEIVGREIYLYCPNGYGKTKLNNGFFERKLKVLATTRNQKTVTALARMTALI